MDILNPHGIFTVEHWYHDKLFDRFCCRNDTTNEGKNRFLNIGFHAYIPITSWWLGIIDNSGYSAVAATDVYTQINGTNGWDEWANVCQPIAQ